MNTQLSEKEKDDSSEQLNTYQQISNEEKKCDSKIISIKLKQSVEIHNSELNQLKDVLNQDQSKEPAYSVIKSNNSSTTIADGIANADQNQGLTVISDNYKKSDKEDFYNEIKDAKNNFDINNIESKTKNENNSHQLSNLNNINSKNTNSDKIVKNIDRSFKIPTPEKTKKSTFIQNNNNRPESAINRKRLSKASSQVVYNHSQKQDDYTRVSPVQSATPTKSNQKIPYSMTSPSEIKLKSNQKNGLFERSLKKPNNFYYDLDDYHNCRFTYSNPYYNNNKMPIVSHITSETSIINEIQKRKMLGQKEDDEELEEMKNQQFRISDYNKKLAKRALMKKNERKIKRAEVQSNNDTNNDEYDPDVIFKDDQILPDDTEIEIRKYKYSTKMPAYLSQVSSFFKDHKDIIKATKNQEAQKLRKIRK